MWCVLFDYLCFACSFVVSTNVAVEIGVYFLKFSLCDVVCFVIRLIQLCFHFVLRKVRSQI